MELNELFKDCSQRQKKGLHFIMASVVVWGLILGVHLTGITIEQKKPLHLLLLCCVVPIGMDDFKNASY